jgi:hypothetical protein
MWYPSNCQKIWYGTQIVLRVRRMGYCTFIEYFALWTWVQHALNVSKLNWSFVSLRLSIWFAIPSWKTLFEQNLQYLYIGGVKYFNPPLILFCLNEQEEQAPCNTFIFFFPHCCQFLGVYYSGNHVGRCSSHVGGVW